MNDKTAMVKIQELEIDRFVDEQVDNLISCVATIKNIVYISPKVRQSIKLTIIRDCCDQICNDITSKLDEVYDLELSKISTL